MAVVSVIALKTTDGELNHGEVQPTWVGAVPAEKPLREQDRTHSAQEGERVNLVVTVLHLVA